MECKQHCHNSSTTVSLLKKKQKTVSSYQPCANVVFYFVLGKNNVVDGSVVKIPNRTTIDQI